MANRAVALRYAIEMRALVAKYTRSMMIVLVVQYGLSSPQPVVAATQAQAQGDDSTVTTGALSGPEPPAVIVRDADGHATIRAIRLDGPLQLDGVLDEEVYQRVLPVDDFIQSVPNDGAPATEKTEVWVMFDTESIYVAARCWDSAPPSEWVANEYRRDLTRQNDTFGVAFDTYRDRRNGFIFYANPVGARADYVVTEEQANFDWNPVWDVRIGRFEGGWMVELEVPFKSLRFRPGAEQVWGIQLRRVVRRKNEWAYLNRVPPSASGPFGFTRISFGGTLVGMQVPTGSKKFEVKPYAITRLTTDRQADPPISNSFDGDFGIDAKYGVTANLTADFTYNPDFAQVEVDERQVNLTRFSLQFPEKREFFLEGRGLFDFGRGARGAGGGGGGGGRGGGGRARATAVEPLLFYSRRIGLEQSGAVPLDFGARLTGKAGRFGIGAMNIQASDDPAGVVPPTNFTALRVKRDVLRRSVVGAMFTNRSNSVLAGSGSNQAYGLDALFSFYENLFFSGNYARTQTPGLETQDTSYQAKFSYTGDRYGAELGHLLVGAHFNPEVGFVRRSDFRRNYALARFSPRPSMELVRKFTLEGSLEYLESVSGALETRVQQGVFRTEFENSDVLSVQARNNYELLVEPFDISSTPEVTIPPGGYSFSDVLLSYQLGTQRRVSGTLSGQVGNSTTRSEGSTMALLEPSPLAAGLRSRRISRLSRRYRSAGSSYRMGTLRTRLLLLGSTTPSRHECSLGDCFNTARATVRLAATSGFDGSTIQGARCSWSIRMRATRCFRAIQRSRTRLS